MVTKKQVYAALRNNIMTSGDGKIGPVVMEDGSTIEFKIIQSDEKPKKKNYNRVKSEKDGEK